MNRDFSFSRRWCVLVVAGWACLVCGGWGTGEVAAQTRVPGAESQAGKPRYTVQRTNRTLRIDGVLGEPAWQAAHAIRGFEFPWYEEGEAELTVARLLWDDQYLYLAFECQDAHLWAEHVGRDSPVYQDDCVEFFTAPDPDRPEAYFNFEMNARAELLDQWHPEGRYSGSDVPWNSEGVRIAVRWQGTLNDDSDVDRGWSLEAAIPWSNFQAATHRLPPSPGDIWRMNLNRCGGKTNPQYSQWTSSGTERPDFHVPGGFGEIQFTASVAGPARSVAPTRTRRAWLRRVSLRRVSLRRVSLRRGRR